MIHLGDSLSALVDGELTGTDLDRANAHLASCERCRGDAVALRVLKTQLRGLTADAGHDDLMPRLLAMAARPAAVSPDEAGVRAAPFRRCLMWSALSLAVVGGVGATAFSLGGTPSGPSGPGPAVVPPVEMFTREHAITAGDDVPLPEPPQLATRAVRIKP